MRTVLVLASLILISACSHPIEIVGKGNVVVLGPISDRGCLYEDYLGGADSCTRNYVVGDYQVTYAADPGVDWPNWYFDHWENYCVGDTLGECSFDIPANVVTRFWGETAPPLVAVFKERGGNPVPDSKIVTVNGREWIRPRMFNGVQWSEIASLCLPGPCSGVLRGFDISGWTWASLEDINALFNYYIGSDELGPGPDSHRLMGIDWQEPFWNDSWGQTGFVGFPPHVYRELWGQTRDCEFHAEVGSNVVRMGVVYGERDFEENADFGIFSTDPVLSLGSCEETSAGFVGAWFYRDLP